MILLPLGPGAKGRGSDGGGLFTCELLKYLWSAIKRLRLKSDADIFMSAGVDGSQGEKQSMVSAIIRQQINGAGSAIN